MVWWMPIVQMTWNDPLEEAIHRWRSAWTQLSQIYWERGRLTFVGMYWYAHTHYKYLLSCLFQPVLVKTVAVSCIILTNNNSGISSYTNLSSMRRDINQLGSEPQKKSVSETMQWVNIVIQFYFMFSKRYPALSISPNPKLEGDKPIHNNRLSVCWTL